MKSIVRKLCCLPILVKGPIFTKIGEQFLVAFFIYTFWKQEWKALVADELANIMTNIRTTDFKMNTKVEIKQ